MPTVPDRATSPAAQAAGRISAACHITHTTPPHEASDSSSLIQRAMTALPVACSGYVLCSCLVLVKRYCCAMTDRTDVTSREALRGLISGASEYLTVADEAVIRAIANPSDRLAVLSAFLFVNHLRDWAGRDGMLPFNIKTCRFYEAIREVANGTKHLLLAPKSHPDLHTAEVMTISGYGRGPYGSGPYGVPYIYLRARRSADEETHFYVAGVVLAEAIGWWKAALTS